MIFEEHLYRIFGDSVAPDGSLARNNFAQWFGKSKVLDELGAPLVVYRGDKPNKSSFTGREDPSNIIQGNIFFTDMPNIGKFYIKHPNINFRTNYMIDPEDIHEEHGLYRVYLSLKNPLCVDAKGESWMDIPIPSGIQSFGDTIQIDDLAEIVKSFGCYDGLIVKNVFDQAGMGSQYVAFSPHQIKSATKNSGAYDLNDPDIADGRALLISRSSLANDFINRMDFSAENSFIKP